MIDWKTSLLGKTNWKVCRLGLASSYGADERCVRMAFERGVNYLYWGSMRTDKFGAGLRSLRSHRHEFYLVTHNRPQAAALASHNGDVDVLHVRYNTVHQGAERDIFPKLPAPAVRPGIVTFTATCWGELMRSDKVPAGDKIPSASDCYRFNLTNPAVDLCLTGPRSASDLIAALDALDKGPMTPEEMDWMRRVGQAKYFRPSLFSIKG